jgi:hypothetical protein
VIPEILDTLKRSGKTEKAALEDAARNLVMKNGLGFRPQAVSLSFAVEGVCGR